MTTYNEEMQYLSEKLGDKDNLIALSTIALETTDDGLPKPVVRLVDAVYLDGAFYVTSYATTDKVRQLTVNPAVSIGIVVESFTAEGLAENLGWVNDEKNVQIMKTVRNIFSEWYEQANDDNDENTCLIKIQLIKGVWNFPHEGIRRDIDFINKTSKLSKNEEK
ncbi:MAG: pyridoxamine 5'-phosphate oxidase family protein [Enterococcus sp.]|nr:pyridoxamine 5'-phosphate oxidase family protein [Enterococcus sp.]